MALNNYVLVIFRRCGGSLGSSSSCLGSLTQLELVAGCGAISKASLLPPLRPGLEQAPRASLSLWPSQVFCVARWIRSSQASCVRVALWREQQVRAVSRFISGSPKLRGATPTDLSNLAP